MADSGFVNPAFVPDVTPKSSPTNRYGPFETPTRRHESLTQKERKGLGTIELQKIQKERMQRHRKSASVGTPIKWDREESTPAKVLRAWKDAQVCLDMEVNSDSEEDDELFRSKGIQTEEPCTTLSSWKLLTTTPSTNSSDDPEIQRSYPSGPSTSYDYVVVESRSLGFEASTQTRDAFLFRYSDAEAFEMVMAWRMLTIFLPITWYMIMYVADQVTDIMVSIDFCRGKDPWWCGLSVTFLVLPHFAINAYAYEQLVRPDIASVAPVNKWFARGLLAAQIAPHYLIFRKWSWCFRAWKKVSWRRQRSKTEEPRHQANLSSSTSPTSSSYPNAETTQRPQKHRKSPKILWEQAKAETYSETVKLYQSLLVSTPQLGIQTYVLMMEWKGQVDNSTVEPILIASVFISLTSASAGLASVLSDKAWEKVAASTAIFLTLGCRVMVLGAVATISKAYWFIPVSCAIFIGVVTKICESKERTVKPILVKMPKYFSEASIMATVCPPFNALGVFTSVPYVVAALVFLLRDPGAAVNIITFIYSILGQIVWLAVGFFVT